MKKFVLALFIFCNLSLFCQGQEVNHRSERKFGIGAQLLGPTLIFSANLNYFITHNFNVEIGAGAIGYYGGLKYYFGKQDKQHKWTPYFGIHYTSVTFFNISLTGNSSNTQKNGIYAPIGIQLMTNGGFTFAPEIAYIHLDNYNKTKVWGAIKLGYNF
jgi:hypothetical protein